MTRISRFRLNQKETQELTDHFSYLISTLTDKKEVENFLESFFTKEEKLMLTKRLILLMMIKKNYTPRVIQNTLHVSYESVRTYANQFPFKNTLFHKTIEKLIAREKTKEFWKKIDKLLKPFELALNAKRDMKARAKLMSGDLE